MPRVLVAFAVLALALGPGSTLAAGQEPAARTFDPEQQDELSAKSDLASTLWAQGDFAGARDLQEQVLEAFTRILGPEHPDTLTSMNNLANTLWDQGDFVGTRNLEEQVLEAYTRILGPEHPDTLIAKENLALTLSALEEAGA